MSNLVDQKTIRMVVNYGLRQLFPLYFKTPLEKDELSSLGIKYPTLRDDSLHSAVSWMKGKRADDRTEGLWRIHDCLYDFSDFVDNHPGGKDWLKLTKGTDITEAFEAHHLSPLPEKLLSRYFISKAKYPRNSPFTFEEKGFYKTLKNNVYNKLSSLPKKPIQRSKLITDALFVFYIISAILAVYFRSFSMGLFSGIMLSMTAITAHNFFHQKDNFRMYYFDFTLMQSRDWRISHVLSHHLYTNTVNDLEISIAEPFLQYLPVEKHIIFRYLSWIYSPIVYAMIYLISFLKTVAQLINKDQEFTWSIVLPFIVPIFTFLITKESPLFCAAMFLWIIVTSGIHFGIVGLNAGHHHPDVFHDGDTPRPKDEMDWGIYQLDAVMDRNDITGSHFLVLTNFGDHALHHLFPTIDHGLLEYLYPIFLETCKEFGTEWRLSTQMETIKGQYLQLAKVEPNKSPPNSKIKK